MGSYIVELKEVELDGELQLVCQGCFKQKRIMKTNQKENNTMSFLQKLKKIGFKFFGVLLFVSFVTTLAHAQGAPGLPGFPDEPAAAPIDGGLGLLAAAGGAYAFKKLRDKKAE